MNKLKFFTLLILVLILEGCFKNSPRIIEIPLETQNIVEDYIKNNISELSPQKEVLGGKFYITEIKFVEPDMIMINYEDGHIALKAQANFKTIDEDVKITNFKLINENNFLITNEYLKCSHHDDCIPLPSCHPHECINQRYQDNYEEPKICTTMYDHCAAYEKNNCLCQQGICFNENLMNPECN